MDQIIEIFVIMLGTCFDTLCGYKPFLPVSRFLGFTIKVETILKIKEPTPNPANTIPEINPFLSG
jgi:hypothetical protein